MYRTVKAPMAYPPKSVSMIGKLDCFGAKIQVNLAEKPVKLGIF